MGSIGDCYDTQSRMITADVGLGGLTRATTGGSCLRVDLSAAGLGFRDEGVERAVTR
jgi:hypothetical protein